MDRGRTGIVGVRCRLAKSILETGLVGLGK
jgi:hypothetical protein